MNCSKKTLEIFLDVDSEVDELYSEIQTLLNKDDRTTRQKMKSYPKVYALKGILALPL